MNIRRLFFKAFDLDSKGASADGAFDGTSPTIPGVREPASEEEANLVSSLCYDGMHMPVLDIDRIPVRLVASTTPGNWHLYIDKPISWRRYVNVLLALRDAGILEAGFVSASIARGATFVRKPGIKKPAANA